MLLGLWVPHRAPPGDHGHCGSAGHLRQGVYWRVHPPAPTPRRPQPVTDARCWIKTSSFWPLRLTEGCILLHLQELLAPGMALHITIFQSHHSLPHLISLLLYWAFSGLFLNKSLALEMSWWGLHLGEPRLGHTSCD